MMNDRKKYESDSDGLLDHSKCIRSDLVKEWHPTKNGDLKPTDVTRGSHKKVWWVCEKGHEWQATIANRNKGNNCPYCANQKILKGYNDLQTINYTLAKEWHPTNNGDLLPADVTPNSNKKVWWQCDKGHEWQAKITGRNKGIGCPYCANRKVLKGYNDLATTSPTLAAQWHVTKNNKLTPNNVTAGSGKKIWWICDKGHEWQTSISHRNEGRNCPVCSNKKILKGYNDLATTSPKLTKQWHPTNNRDLNPTDVTCGSSRKAWWVCDKGHEWEATIASRNAGNGCPICSSERNTSFPEQVIYYYLKKIFTSTSNRKLINKKEADIFIEEFNLIIEYDGVYFHKNKMRKDRDKNKAFQNYHFIRIRENGLMPIEDHGCINYILKNTSNSQLEEMIYFIFDYIKQHFSLTEQVLNQIKELKVNLNEDQIKIYNTFILKEKESSLYAINPTIAKEWHPTKNGSLTPEHVSPNSNKKAWWMCDEGHEWKAVISNRSRGRGCPYCENRKLLKGYNDLTTINPKLTQQWNYSKNGNLTPCDVAPGSGKNVWWICDKGHEWQAKINNRNNGNGCPYCSGRNAIKGYNDLQTINPILAKQWHLTKNGDLKPSSITCSSNKKVWWQCEKGHEWQAVVNNRNNGNGCPYCSGRNKVNNNIKI